MYRSNRSNSLAPTSSSTLNEQSKQSNVTEKENNQNNIYNLVTKLYISSPTIPSGHKYKSQLKDDDQDLFNSDPSYILKAKFTNHSNKNLANKILVFIDFKTNLKIETFFECTVTSLTTCREIIFHIVRKLNNLITKLNKLKQLTDMNFIEYYDDVIKVENSKDDERFVRLMSMPSKFKLNTYEFVANLEENLNLYSLVIVVDSKERVLIDNFYLAQLREPWVNGRFYLKKNNLV